MHPLNVAGSVVVKRGVPALGATLERRLMKLEDAGNEVHGHYPLGGPPKFSDEKTGTEEEGICPRLHSQSWSWRFSACAHSPPVPGRYCFESGPATSRL